MNNLINRVQLIGNIGSTPVLQQTSNGKVYSKISLATNSTYVDKEGNKIKETQWHPIVVWGKKAEIAEKYITKGQEICIDGKLNYRTYEDNNGDTKNVFEIIATEILLLKK